jgi:hypothetical protein
MNWVDVISLRQQIEERKRQKEAEKVKEKAADEKLLREIRREQGISTPPKRMVVSEQSISTTATQGKPESKATPMTSSASKMGDPHDERSSHAISMSQTKKIDSVAFEVWLATCHGHNM